MKGCVATENLRSDFGNGILGLVEKRHVLKFNAVEELQDVLVPLSIAMKKLNIYQSAGLGAAAMIQSSAAATVVTFYGPGAQSTSSSVATPAGIDIGLYKGDGYLDTTFTKFPYVYFARNNSLKTIFNDGIDLVGINSFDPSGRYSYGSVLTNGAQAGSDNYANITFEGLEFEAVGQFSLDGLGGGYLIALAINDDGSALSISQGKAAIDAVPEPSALALLSLGAAGTIMRRRRKPKVA